MSVLDDVKEVFHRVRVKLYPSHLEDLKGTFYARTANEKTLDYKEVCKMAKERDGYTGNLDVLTEDVAVFLRESAHQMCDGFAINFGGLAFPRRGMPRPVHGAACPRASTAGGPEGGCRGMSWCDVPKKSPYGAPPQGR